MQTLNGTTTFPMREIKAAVYLCLFLLAFFAPACRNAASNEKLATLTRAEEIINLSPEERERGYPVRLQGVITYYDPEWHVLFFQDSTGGIYIDPQGQDLKVHAGQMAEIEGGSASSNLSVAKPRIKVICDALFPPPKRFTLRQAAAAGNDALSQWIAVSGAVRSAEMQDGRFTLTLTAGGQTLKAVVLDAQHADPAALVDTDAVVVGVCAAAVDQSGKINGCRLLVPSLSKIEIKRAAPPDPFSLPTQPIGSLLKLTPATLQPPRTRAGRRDAARERQAALRQRSNGRDSNTFAAENSASSRSGDRSGGLSLRQRCGLHAARSDLPRVRRASGGFRSELRNDA